MDRNPWMVVEARVKDAERGLVQAAADALGMARYAESAAVRQLAAELDEVLAQAVFAVRVAVVQVVGNRRAADQALRREILWGGSDSADAAPVGPVPAEGRSRPDRTS